MRRMIVIGAMILWPVGTAAAQDWKAPASAKTTRNPAARDAGIKAGKSLYESNCVMCHGNSGKGDGPAGPSLNPKPKNLADKSVQAQTDGELFWKISEGRGVMPGWKQLPEKDRWSLVHYLRSLAAK